ncbi:MAG: MFS transporter [Campylobacteraceae bacterium]
MKSNKRRLNKKDYKTLGLSSLGGTLEFYDFVIYALLIETIVKPLFLPPDFANTVWGQVYAWGGFAAAYAARPIGGVIMAHFGDTLGRKKMFTLSVAMMALPTFIIGIMPTYETINIFAPVLLILMRMLQGAAIGGEMPGAWVFIAEHTQKSKYGMGIGVLTSGITGGIFLGFLAIIILNKIFTPDEVLHGAWRILFILGGLFGVISVFLRRYLSETPIFQEMAERKELSKEVPVITVIKKHRLACFVVGFLTWTLSTTVMVAILITPTLILQKLYGLNAIDAGITGLILAGCLTLGCVIFGFLEDKLQTRATALIAYIGLIISSFWFYSSLFYSPSIDTIHINAAILGIFTGSIVLTPIIGTRAFPPIIRYSGLSFSYNLAYAIFSFITPMFTIFLTTKYFPAFYTKHIGEEGFVGQLLPELEKTSTFGLIGPAIYISIVAIVGIIVTQITISRRGYKAK